jgi:hypothetical protein
MSNETVPQEATAKADALKAEANSLFAGKHIVILLQNDN